MNYFEKILYLLQAEMPTPKPFGWYHLMWLGFIAIALFLLYKRKNHHSETQLKVVLGVYGVIALLLETAKQLIWTFDFDSATNTIAWDYQWYAFPFQLCSTPIYVALICLFLKKGKIRDSLLSYIAYITILGSIATMIMPDSCFTSDILVNIHTMWLHFGSFVVSVYLLTSGEIKPDVKYFKKAIPVLLLFIVAASVLNITIYKSEILNGEEFNMFYISPYFISSLPVFDSIQQRVPYIIFLLSYIFVLILGAFIICGTAWLLTRTNKNTTIESWKSATKTRYRKQRIALNFSEKIEENRKEEFWW